MISEAILQEIQEWAKENKISIDCEKFLALCEESDNATYTLGTFDAEGELSDLLDYFSWDLKNDLEAFFQSLEDLRVYASEEAVIEDFIEAFDVCAHVARYLDEEQIVRDFLYGGGFQIGSLYCESW